MNPLYVAGIIGEWKAGLSFILSATVGVVALGQAGGQWVTLDSYYLSPSTPVTVPAETVVICHQPGTPAGQDLEVSPDAVEAHLGHGDHEGPCLVFELGENVQEARMEERQEAREERQEAREEAMAEREEAREEARAEREEAREEARAEREEAREAEREERQEAREERQEARQEAREERQEARGEPDRGGPPPRR